jgi:hypothetical protein
MISVVHTFDTTNREDPAIAVFRVHPSCYVTKRVANSEDADDEINVAKRRRKLGGFLGCIYSAGYR